MFSTGQAIGVIRLRRCMVPLGMFYASPPCGFDATDIVWSSRRRRVRNIEEKALVRIGSGAYIAERLLDPSAPKWRFQRQVQVARAMTVANLPNQTSRRLLTMQSALEVRGLPTGRQLGPVEYRTEDATGSRRTLELPMVTVRGVSAPPGQTLKLLGKRLVSKELNVLGTPTVSLTEAALDLALYGSPLGAYVGVSVVLNQLSRFDPFRYQISRRNEARVKSKVAELLAPIDGTRGHARARKIIQLADAAIESPPEAQVLWLLHVLLRRNRTRKARFESQYWVFTDLGPFRVDVGFPILRFYLEFDGRGKLIVDDHSAESWQARQAALLDAGWTGFRISSRDLRDIPALAELLSDRLGRLGLIPAPPGGPLWEPAEAPRS